MKTAREVLREFLKAWENEAWDKMKKNCQKTWVAEHSSSRFLSPRRILKNMFGNIKLVEWEDGEEFVVGEACFDIEVTATLEVKDEKHFREVPKQGTGKVRLICEKAPYKPHLVAGTWGVNPISALKIIGGMKA